MTWAPADCPDCSERMALKMATPDGGRVMSCPGCGAVLHLLPPPAMKSSYETRDRQIELHVPGHRIDGRRVAVALMGDRMIVALRDPESDGMLRELDGAPVFRQARFEPTGRVTRDGLEIWAER